MSGAAAEGFKDFTQPPAAERIELPQSVRHSQKGDRATVHVYESVDRSLWFVASNCLQRNFAPVS